MKLRGVFEEQSNKITKVTFDKQYCALLGQMGNMTQMEMILFVLCQPRWSEQEGVAE